MSAAKRAPRSTQRLIDLPLAVLQPDPGQPRQHFDEGSINRLAGTFDHHGFIHPIRVRPQGAVYIILGGERRWRAATKAGLTNVPCLVIEGELTEDDIYEGQVVDNEHREDLDPIDKAKAYQNLMERRGWSVNQLCKNLHLVLATVKKLLTLLNLVPEVQEFVHSGALTQAAAQEVAKLPATQQAPMAKLIVYQRLTAAAAAAAIRRQTGKPHARYGATRMSFPLDRHTRVMVVSKRKLNPLGIVEAIGGALTEANQEVLASTEPAPEAVTLHHLIALLQAYLNSDDSSLEFALAGVTRRIAPVVVQQLAALRDEPDDENLRIAATIALNQMPREAKAALAPLLVRANKK